MYQPWKMRALPDPRETPRADVNRHLREIVAAEGPVHVNRAYQIYARACGINCVGRMMRSKLNSALYSLVRRKDVLLEREGPDDSQINAIARPNGAPQVIVRSAGPRTFWDIPPSELATVMREEGKASPGSDAEEIYRRVLLRYEVGRLTSGIRSELVRIDRMLPEDLFRSL